MRRLFNIFIIVLVIAVFAYPREAGQPYKSVVLKPVTWGAYTGNTDQDMADFESMVGAKMNVHAIFWGWDSDFPESAAGAQGKTLLIFWDPEFGYNDINNNSMDFYITKFAKSAKAYNSPIILVPFSEFNLNEAAWGNGIGANTPEGFISAWRKVHGIFAANGATNVKFGLAYNNVSIPESPFASFYPGDEYVDLVGVDGFNMDNSQTFGETFNTALAEVRAFKKPVWIFSTGTINPQIQFIYDLGQTGLPWIWFNQAPYNVDPKSINIFKSIL